MLRIYFDQYDVKQILLSDKITITNKLKNNRIIKYYRWYLTYSFYGREIPFTVEFNLNKIIAKITKVNEKLVLLIEDNTNYDNNNNESNNNNILFNYFYQLQKDFGNIFLDLGLVKSANSEKIIPLVNNKQIFIDINNTYKFLNENLINISNELIDVSIDINEFRSQNDIFIISKGNWLKIDPYTVVTKFFDSNNEIFLNIYDLLDKTIEIKPVITFDYIEIDSDYKIKFFLNECIITNIF